MLNYDNNTIRKKVTRKSLKQMHSMIFGYGELEGIKNTYKIRDNDIEVNLFGVDTAFWRPSKTSRVEYVLSVGNDARRDFETLIKSALLLKKHKFIIITKINLDKYHIPKNVTVLKGSWQSNEIDDIELRKIYHHAACIVVPLKNTLQPSGQSVALQAMACGRPVILTKTEGLWENRNLGDGKNIRFVRAGDFDQLSEAISEIVGSNEIRNKLGKEGRRYVLKHARIEHFAERIEKRCHLMVN